MNAASIPMNRVRERILDRVRELEGELTDTLTELERAEDQARSTYLLSTKVSELRTSLCSARRLAGVQTETCQPSL